MRNRGSIGVEKDIIGLVRGREYNGIEKKCGVDKTREAYGSVIVEECGSGDFVVKSLTSKDCSQQ